MFSFLLLEAPFVEPSLPRPYLDVAGDLLRGSGHTVQTLDLNARIYRHLLDLPLPPLLVAPCGRLALRDSLIKAFFLTRETSDSDAPLAYGVRGLEGPLLSAFDAEDYGALERHRLDTMRRMTGAAPFAGHQQYVVDQEFLNAILDLRVKGYGVKASLSLEGLSFAPECSEPHYWSRFLSEPGNLIEQLACDATEGLLEFPCEAVFIRVGCFAQIAGAIAVAGWLKRGNVGQVILAGGVLYDQASCSGFRLIESTDAVMPYELPEAIQHYLAELGATTAAPVSVTVTELQVSRSVTGDRSDYLTPLSVASLQATVGCYWSRCAFCSVPAYSDRFGSASPEKLVAALEDLAVAGTKGIQFLDYALPYPLLSALAESSLSGVHWAGQVRFEAFLLCENLLSNLYRSGCTSLSFGFESGSPGLLAQMDKGGCTENSLRRDILRTSAQAGIRNHLFLITGLPGESEEDFLATVDFLHGARQWVHSIEVYPFQMQTGSLISRCPDRFAALPVVSGTTARARAEALQETFSYLSAQSAMNDWLEGHIPLMRSLV